MAVADKPEAAEEKNPLDAMVDDLFGPILECCSPRRKPDEGEVNIIQFEHIAAKVSAWKVCAPPPRTSGPVCCFI